MAIGTGTAILGSSLISGIGSIFGAKGANKAAQANAAAAAANTASANQAVYESLVPARQSRQAAADIYSSGLQSGQDAWWNQMAPIADQAAPALGNINALNANYGGNTQFNDPTAYTGNTQFNRDTEIGGHWDNLASQNFFESPDYQFRQQEALDAVQGSAAAAGGLYSGNTLKDITDRASNLAAGEYGNWFNRQLGLADRNYGADVSNYDRDAGQFASNFARDYGVFSDNYGRASDQFSSNFARDYGVFSDNYGRDFAQNQYLANQGINALTSGAALDYGVETGIGQAQADVLGQYGQDIINAGQTYSNNLMGNAGMQTNTPYVSPWGGINSAIQGGLQNYLWAQNAGLLGGSTGQPGYSAAPTWQQTYGGDGNYGHIFDPLYGGGNKITGAVTYPYPGGPQVNFMGGPIVQ